MLELLKYDFFQNALISTLLIGISSVSYTHLTLPTT